MRAAAHEGGRLCCMHTGTSGENDHVDIERRIHGPTIDSGPFTETLRDEFCPLDAFVAQHHLIGVGGHQLPGEPRSDGAHADDADASHLSRALGR